MWGKSHLIKGFERIKNLQNVINKQDLNEVELQIAQELLDDLVDALKGVGQ